MTEKKHIDQMGREMMISYPPKRIISLVPSQTELLHHFDLENEVAGITKFCVHPDAWFRTKKRIGGTKKVNHAQIKSLNPDLIIANKEENTLEDIQKLEKDYPVWISDIKSFEDALQMINALGIILNRQSKSQELTASLRLSFSQITLPAIRKKVLYLIWKKPFMAAGRDTFINEMLSISGFENAINDTSSRYPSLSEDEIHALNPDLLFLSSEPFPFAQFHVEQFQHLFTSSKTIIVDGELFSWYGSRLLKAPAYFEKLKTVIE